VALSFASSETRGLCTAAFRPAATRPGSFPCSTSLLNQSFGLGTSAYQSTLLQSKFHVKVKTTPLCGVDVLNIRGDLASNVIGNMYDVRVEMWKYDLIYVFLDPHQWRLTSDSTSFHSSRRLPFVLGVEQIRISCAAQCHTWTHLGGLKMVFSTY
jgi:hypothetical protein